jgi:hypothetical protein
LSKYPRLLRLIFCLALVQVVAPSLVAIADAWRMDKREAYLHVESETSSGCVVVHHDDCALCAFISTCAALPKQQDPWPTHAVTDPLDIDEVTGAFASLTASARPRAPPVS